MSDYWTHLPACPQCGAAAGDPCRTANVQAALPTPHVDRLPKLEPKVVVAKRMEQLGLYGVQLSTLVASQVEKETAAMRAYVSRVEDENWQLQALLKTLGLVCECGGVLSQVETLENGTVEVSCSTPGHDRVVLSKV